MNALYIAVYIGGGGIYAQKREKPCSLSPSLAVDLLLNAPCYLQKVRHILKGKYILVRWC